MVMFRGDRVLLSPTDITAASGCEYGWLAMKVDPKLGRRPQPKDDDDFLERVSRLGDVHEERVLAGFREELGAGRVVELPRTEGWDAETVEAGVARSVEALRSDTDVVFQALLHDGAFGGFADFLVRQEDGRWQVVDTKLARHARVTALLQIAAYADLLVGLGVPRVSEGVLWLGDDAKVTADLDEIIPVYRRRRARLEGLLAEHVASDDPVAWGRDDLSICGQCEACAEAIAESGDVLQIAGATRLQRGRARAAGITTVAEMAASEQPPAGMARRTWEGLRAQARMQLAPAREDGRPPFEIVDRTAVDLLPAPDEGDIFFDFEGDPLWSAPDGRMEGLEYLFGWVAPVPGRATAETGFDEFEFTPLWAHTRTEEKAALERFAEYVEARRAEHPGMRIYHYAPYEVTALKRLTVRHGVHEGTLDDWLRAGLFMDLYSTVRSTLRAGVASYSIKKLEPLYMGDDHRAEDGVTTAADSVNEYHRWAVLHEAGLAGDAAKAAEAERVLAGIGDYNRYDCVSTVRLRDWLLAEAGGLRGRGEGGAGTDGRDGSAPGAGGGSGPLEERTEGREADAQDDAALADRLLDLVRTSALGPEAAADPEVPLPEFAQLDDEERGLALLAAALGYFPRENKPLWWAYFDRGISPLDEWQDPRENCAFDEILDIEEWHVPPGKRNNFRRITVTARLAAGTEVKPGAKLATVYEDVPPDAVLAPNARRWFDTDAAYATVKHVEELADGLSEVTMSETLTRGADGYDERPVAAFCHDPVRSHTLKKRIRDLARIALFLGRLPTAEDVGVTVPADGVDDTSTCLRSAAVVDLLARRLPRTRQRSVAEISRELRSASGVDGTVEGGNVARVRREGHEALVEAIESARGSYVAVQGPPGTGKTHTGAHAVKALMDRGWSVGVVAQSHAVVENFLTKLRSVGVDQRSLTKAPRNGHPLDPDAAWTWTGHPEARPMGAPGTAFGGTAWTFAHQNAEPVDLMVIDEAGQYSLAMTLAAASQARTVLLLGDPQQLPQVSRGTHPAPVDEAALSWLMSDHGSVLPAELGFFLDTTWRMHSELTEPVSALSYGGQLGAKQDITDGRCLDGIAPGLHSVPVEHFGNDVASPEEAAEVVRLVRDAIGQTWTKDPKAAPGEKDGPRPLEDADIIVITPYNAQVATLRRALDEAGFKGTAVGTVDRFQGREAAIAIVSMAASSAEDVPRGLDFLLNRNRLNVSVSRGQWAAYLVHSPAFGDALPTNPADLPLIGRFLRLVDAGRETD